MAYTTINKSTENFNTVTYTGNGLGTRAVTGVGFQPDLVWIKGRSVAEHHNLYDAIRGATKPIYTNLNYAEATVANSLKSFGGDGFTISDNAYIGQNNATYASWNWKANGGTTVTNNDGATTSYVSHNSTSQFSIIKYTGTGSNTNIGHGLNGTPDCFITKGYSGATDWHLWNNSFTVNQRIKINSNGVISSNTSIFPALPDATKIYLGGGGDVNQSGIEYICYAWKNVNGFSKFGSYKGNGSTDGAFIYTGFKPAFVIRKKTNANGNWIMQDSKRPSSQPFNEKRGEISGNTTSAETSSQYYIIDFLSNGFKCRTADSEVNGTGGEYIYMAFASAPLVGSNNVPCTAI